MGVKKFLSVFQGPLAVWVIIATVKSFIVGFDVKKKRSYNNLASGMAQCFFYFYFQLKNSNFVRRKLDFGCKKQTNTYMIAGYIL